MRSQCYLLSLLTGAKHFRFPEQSRKRPACLPRAGGGRTAGLRRTLAAATLSCSPRRAAGIPRGRKERSGVASFLLAGGLERVRPTEFDVTVRRRGPSP
jgi:hypothetical protein